MKDVFPKAQIRIVDIIKSGSCYYSDMEGNSAEMEKYLDIVSVMLQANHGQIIKQLQ